MNPAVRSHWLQCLAVFLALTSRAAGQTVASKPEELGISSSRLEAVTAYLRSEVEAGRIAGAVGLVARHGRLAYLEAVGSMDVEAGKPMRADTLFRVASMTKTITSVAVMTLVEDGEIGLGDPVSKFLPDFSGLVVLSGDAREGPVSTVPAQREITIHDLLTHTSGITYGWSGPEALSRLYREAKVPDTFLPLEETMGERVARLSRLPLKFQPGTSWDYGLSLDVLGHLVERVSGLNLEQFFRERIFRPLRMRDTRFFVADADLGRLAAVYTPDEKGALRRVGDEPVTAGVMTFTANYCHGGSRKFFSGGGGLVSTAADYARFLQMLLNGGELEGARVLEPSTVARMTRNQIGELSIAPWGHGDAFGYGFGVLTERGQADDPASVGTYSWGGIFNTYYWVDPQEQLIGILMTQVYPFGHLTTRGEFKRLVHEALDDSGFARWYWYETGSENGNPFFSRRQLRVNAPEAATHPRFAARSETRSSGLARILIAEDLREIRRAELYCELWGGHPGTANKRVGINGRSLYHIPEVGSSEGHSSHQYPVFNLRASDLVNGYNSLQFACDRGDAFWGHYIVDNACLRIGLSPDDAGLREAGLGGFRARVDARCAPDGESFRLVLDASPEELARISAVHYQGSYFGYDENGDTRSRDWHGMSKARSPHGVIGSSTESPFEVTWDTRMLGAQKNVSVRALLRFRDHAELAYLSAPTRGLEIPERASSRVELHHATELPRPFWSRAGRKLGCTIDLDLDPGAIEAARLHVVAWTGGAGDVESYFTLNGKAFPVAEGSAHEVVYSRLPVDPAILKRGPNRIELLSSTEHHGIEILRPGPALVIRLRGTSVDAERGRRRPKKAGERESRS